MNINPVSEPLAPASDLLSVFLVTDHNFSTVSNEVKKNYSSTIEISSKNKQKGEKSTFLWKDLNLLAIGLGPSPTLEEVRKAVFKSVECANEEKISRICISVPGKTGLTEIHRAVAETIILGNYQFLNYKSEKKANSLKEGFVVCKNKEEEQAVKKGLSAATSACIARDLVNEPLSTLNAEELSKRAENLGKTYGFSVEVLNKAKIKALKMGGLLAVNLGSPDPPTFTIMEWAPKTAKNKKPVVLVGKGVVYDTGGLSLKPTAGSMDFMKSDMAGAAAVIGAMAGIAALNLPVRVIGLVPATDNRPGMNAYVPGDVIKMFDGSTVEVLNTDAEGRMLLADALAYAKKYKPELVIDLATLTGAAKVAVGTIGIAMMSTADDSVKDKLKKSGENVHERLVELPLWDEYGEQLKSDIADLKNVGGKWAGSITAGKFLEHFTDYPWVHLDIAGPSYLHSAESYRGKNGTGAGVRLLLDFLEKFI